MMTTSNENEIPQSKKIMLWVLTAGLWVATLVMGFLAFVAIQDIATTGVGFLLSRIEDMGLVERRGWVTTTRNVSTILAGLAWLTVAVGGMEYHFRHMGQRRSYRLFAWTLGIEMALLIINVLFF
ncbi:MAG TPA: hypothetical protein VKY59_18070 [Spirillospora sp.]|nr:hypothetical protein [Spirillospora sp.]